MKVHIYGGAEPRERSLRILGGGYDAKMGRAVLIIQDDEGFPGTMHFDVSEARQVGETLINELPRVELVTPTAK